MSSGRMQAVSYFPSCQRLGVFILGIIVLCFTVVTIQFNILKKKLLLKILRYENTKKKFRE